MSYIFPVIKKKGIVPLILIIIFILRINIMNPSIFFLLLLLNNSYK